jgi:hypothetical protein
MIKPLVVKIQTTALFPLRIGCFIQHDRRLVAWWRKTLRPWATFLIFFKMLVTFSVQGAQLIGSYRD